MRIPARFLPLLVLSALAVAVALGFGESEHTRAATTHTRVLMIDNEGTFAPGDPDTGEWGFAPFHVTVAQGEEIEFENPAGNTRPHNVVSLIPGGTSFERTWESGTRFNSGPAREQLTNPGQSWTLTTAGMDPGHYLYYCSLHPWMVGTFTVTPQS